MCDAVDDARRAIEALREEGAVRGSLPLRTAAASYAAALALRRGDLRTAQGEAQDALALAGEELNCFGGGALTTLVCASAEAGEFTRARELLDPQRIDRTRGAVPWDISVPFARAQLALSEGDFDRAEAEARAAGAMRERQGRVNPTWTRGARPPRSPSLTSVAVRRQPRSPTLSWPSPNASARRSRSSARSTPAPSPSPTTRRALPSADVPLT